MLTMISGENVPALESSNSVWPKWGTNPCKTSASSLSSVTSSGFSTEQADPNIPAIYKQYTSINLNPLECLMTANAFCYNELISNKMNLTF
jgi:hypothetical protein